MRFLFIRHGETDWNRQGRMQGSNDIPLNQTGIEQAFSAATLLKPYPIKKIVTSPQIRAKHTADIISQAFGAAVHLEPDLRERHFGDYEGTSPDNLPRIPVDPHAPDGPFDYPQGKVEPFRDVSLRSKSAIERWLASHDKSKEGVLLFVAHGGVFSALHHALECGAYFRIKNATPYEFARQADGRWTCQPV